jgi:hypothetical protein
MKTTNWKDCIKNRPKWKEFVEKAKTSQKKKKKKKKKKRRWRRRRRKHVQGQLYKSADGTHCCISCKISVLLFVDSYKQVNNSTKGMYFGFIWPQWLRETRHFYFVRSSPRLSWTPLYLCPAASTSLQLRIIFMYTCMRAKLLIRWT